MVIRIAVVICFECHTLLCGSCHYARGHNLVCFHFVQTHEVTDNLILILLYHAFFFAHIGHSDHFLATNRCLIGFGEQTRNELYEFHYWVHHENEYAYGVRCQAHEMFPIGSTNGLREDLGEDQDEYGHYGTAYAEPSFAEDECSLHTYATGTYGVGNGVERQYCR